MKVRENVTKYYIKNLPKISRRKWYVEFTQICGEDTLATYLSDRISQNIHVSFFIPVLKSDSFEKLYGLVGLLGEETEKVLEICPNPLGGYYLSFSKSYGDSWSVYLDHKSGDGDTREKYSFNLDTDDLMDVHEDLKKILEEWSCVPPVPRNVTGGV